MKLIHLKNLKRECVLVELPEGHTLEDYVGETDEIGLPNLLGKFTDLREENFEGLVEREEFVKGHRSLGFRNYNGSKYDWFGTARESFISAIEAEGWYVNGNPYKKLLERTASNEEEALAIMGLVNEAQEKVINLGNCYLFVKL